MTLAFPYLIITNGSTTVTISDGVGSSVSSYPINPDGWAPAVAPRRQNQLGGLGTYDNVVEEMDISITGATVSALYANLATLNQLLDFAERWYDGDNVGAVELRWAPQGSTTTTVINYLTAVILGRAPGDSSQAPIALPKTFLEAGVTRYLLPVRLRFWRRGAWTQATTVSSSGAAVNSGTIRLATFGSSAGTNSPLLIAWSGITTGVAGATLDTWPAGVMLYSYASSRIEVVDGESLAGGAYTSVADGANKARNTNVLRYTPVATTTASSGVLTAFSSLVTTINRIAIYAVLRNNTAGKTYTVQAYTSNRGKITYGPSVIVPYNAGQPEVYFLGELTSSQGHANLALQMSVSSTGGTLDVDYLAVVSTDSRGVEGAIAWEAVSGLVANLGGAVSIGLQFDPAYVTGITPRVQILTAGAVTIDTGYRGDALLETTGSNVYACWIATQGAFWRPTTIDGTLMAPTLLTTRYTASTVPV